MSLVIAKQTSLATERFSQNGVVKNVHYVIKRHNIDLEVQLNPTPINVNVNQLTLDAHLIYDSPDLKEVECIRQKPFAFKSMLRDTDPVCFRVEASISVLSSQHEDMNFRIRFSLPLDNASAPLTVCSDPIQVISKPEVLETKNQPRKRKRSTFNETVLSTLSRIENLQREQLQNAKLGMNFEEAFKCLVRCYADEPEEERSGKLRKLASDISPKEGKLVTEIVDTLSTSGYGAPPSPPSSWPSPLSVEDTPLMGQAMPLGQKEYGIEDLLRDFSPDQAISDLNCIF